MAKKILYSAVFVLLVLATARVNYAQANTARLQGTVMDSSGAAVVNATVTVTDVDTGRTVTARTDAEGFYVVPGLAPGHYQATVEMQGFQKEVRNFELQISQIGEVDYTLQVGSVSQSVTVTGGSPVVDTADSAIGTVIEGRQVTELPLNGRNFTQLATLIPGVSRGNPTGQATGSQNNAETFRNGSSGGASLAVNGLPPQANNFILDGIDNNEALVNTIVFFPPADAIQEFRVETSVAPAEFGRAGGAIVATSIKSGTNDFHGSAFWFHRDQTLDARPFFASARSPFSRNQFGGTIGGPIIRNKLFFFGDYQGLRLKQPGQPEFATVPTDKMRAGDFSELLTAGPGTGLSNPVQIIDPTTGAQFMGNGSQPNVIPGNRINTVGQNYLKAFPEPNCNAAINSNCDSILHNYTNVRNLLENWNDFDIRVDFNLNADNQFFGRFSRGRADQTETTRLSTLPSGFGSGTNFNHPYGAALGWTHILSPNVINEARYGFVRTYYGFAPPSQGTPLCTQLGIPNCNTSPDLGGIALIGGFNSQIEYTGDFGPFLVPQTGFDFNDSVSWVHGNHTIKFGATIIRRQLNLFRPLAGKGFFFLWGNGGGQSPTHYEVSDLLAGFVHQYDHGTPFGMVGTRSWENGFFAQDDWRLNARLTLNLGIRYDVLTQPIEVQNRQANFDLTTGSLVIAGVGGSSRALVPNDWHNFGPRLGFAYQLTGDGKTVLRGGFGLFYFLDRGGISNQLSQNPPFSGEQTVDYVNGFRITLSGSLPCQPTCTAAQLDSTQATGPLPSGAFTNLNLSSPSGVSVIADLPSNTTPNVSEWNLQIQRQIGTNTSVSLAYVGDHGAHLPAYYDANNSSYGLAASDPNSRLFPLLGSISVQDTRGTSDFHSLQAQYERRMTRNWQFLGAFTWEKVIDDTCGAFDCSQPQNFRNFKIERGLSAVDQPYRLVLSSLYELPFGRGERWGSDWSRPIDLALGGWQINGIYTLQSGFPFDVSNGGGIQEFVRPDLTARPSVSPGNIAQYINPAGFAPAPATLFPDGSISFNRPGNAARNFLFGPGLSNIDFAVFKNFHLTERFNAQFRTQFYNLTNTPHFGQPNAGFGNWGTVTDPVTKVTSLQFNPNPQFGQINSVLPDSWRQIEIALRITF
ncbi:MAG: TonB-dependent receptor [Candidatus Acidiferrales bacterium]